MLLSELTEYVSARDELLRFIEAEEAKERETHGGGEGGEAGSGDGEDAGVGEDGGSSGMGLGETDTEAGPTNGAKHGAGGGGGGGARRLTARQRRQLKKSGGKGGIWLDPPDRRQIAARSET